MKKEKKVSSDFHCPKCGELATYNKNADMYICEQGHHTDYYQVHPCEK